MARIILTKEAREAQREYKRRWREANPEKQREYNRTFWERKAAEYAAEREAKGGMKNE